MSLVGKYRPQSWDEVIGQDIIVKSLKHKGDDLPHLMFVGPPGCGKTTVAYVLAKANGLPIEELNASDERGIATVRGKIKQLSRIKGKRILFLDEADNMTNDAQNSLRAIMEKTKSTIFILSGNKPYKFIEPIYSRCSDYYFERLDDEIVLRRVLEICVKEEITVEPDSKEGFIELIRQTNGDLRKAINTLEKVVDEGSHITEETVLSFRRPKISGDALNSAISGNFDKARKLIEDAFIESSLDPDILIKEMYESIGELKDANIKIKLYRELSRIAPACKYGNDPIVMFVGFIAYVWLVPHINSDCPVLKGE